MISIVTTMYRSAPYVREFYERTLVTLKKINSSYEMIFVDDGYPDEAKDIAIGITHEDPNVKVIELSRNFGHHRAMMEGLRQSQGDWIYLTDIDLEEDPEYLEAFWKQACEHNYDLIYGVVEEKGKGGFGRRWMRNLFYATFNAISEVKIPENECVTRLMNRSFVNALTLYGEKNIFLPALWVDVGLRRCSLEIERIYKGSSSYTLQKKVHMAVDAITSFSSRPLTWIFYFGVSVSFLSALSLLWLVIRHLFFESPILGWTSLIASIYLMGGLTILVLGVIGIYLSKIFYEVKGRPATIIKKVHSHDQ